MSWRTYAAVGDNYYLVYFPQNVSRDVSVAIAELYHEGRVDEAATLVRLFGGNVSHHTYHYPI